MRWAKMFDNVEAWAFCVLNVQCWSFMDQVVHCKTLRCDKVGFLEGQKNCSTSRLLFRCSPSSPLVLTLALENQNYHMLNVTFER